MIPVSQSIALVALRVFDERVMPARARRMKKISRDCYRNSGCFAITNQLTRVSVARLRSRVRASFSTLSKARSRERSSIHRAANPVLVTIRFFSRLDQSRLSPSFLRPRKIGSAIARGRFNCCERRSQNNGTGQRPSVQLFRRRRGSGGAGRRDGSGSALDSSRLDLVTYLRDAGQTDFVEQRDHVAVHGQRFGTEGHLDVLVLLVELVKPVQNIVAQDRDVIEIDESAFRH